MKKTETQTTVDGLTAHRRGFLSKLLVGSAALPMMASAVTAGPQQDGKGAGRGRKGRPGQGQAGKSGARGAMGRGRGQQQRDPADMAKRMMEQFDKDGDGKLSLQELTNALKAMQERRSSLAAGGGSPAGKGSGAGGKGKGKGAGKGKGGGDEILGGQGVVPKKPGQ